MDKQTKDFLWNVGSTAVGIWVLKELIKNGKYNKCPRCNYRVNKHMTYCTNCGQPLAWGNKQNEELF